MATEGARATATRWRMLAVLVAARLALGLAFQSAGSAAPYLADDFSMSLAEIGALVGAFMLPGAVFALPAGMLGARFGDRRLVIVGFAAMAAGLALSSAASSWWIAALGRMLTGAGAVPAFVLMVKMAFDWFAAGRWLFVATALFLIGWPLGHALGQALLTPLADAFGWRAAFAATAAISLAAAGLLWSTYAPPPDAAARAQAPLSALTRREVALTSLAGALWMTVNGAYVVALGFGAELLIERGASPVRAAAVASLTPWAFLIALPLGAWTATRFGAPTLVMAASLALSAALGVWTAVEGAALGFLGFGFAMAFGIAAIAALPSEALSAASRSVGLGYYFIWYFLGSAAAPAIAGWVGDAVGTAAGPLLLAALLQAASLPLLAAFRRLQRRGETR